ncbi:MAG: HD domain-containing protein, partial [Bacteroidota bacterium]
MWKIVENQNWQYIRNTFSWIRDMESVAQDPIYHAEGNVAVHTKMVVEALLALPEYQQLKEQDQQILFAAALLHDVEKRSTTIKESDGRITSRKHALKGEFTTRTILYKEIATPFSVREKVAKLVRYHGLPIWIMEKNDPEAALLQASLEVDTQHLAILAKADMLGRICPDQEEMLYRIELFQEFCKELDCLGKPKWFGSDLGRYEYFKKRLDGQSITPDYVPFEKNTFEVILMCALPGTGKDFFIQKNFKDFLVVSLDD